MMMLMMHLFVLNCFILSVISCDPNRICSKIDDDNGTDVTLGLTPNLVCNSVGDEDNCRSWEHHFLIVLHDRTLDDTIQSIENFMILVTEHCNQDSTAFLSLPASHDQCQPCQFGYGCRAKLRGLIPNDTFISAFPPTESTPLLNMFNKQIECAKRQQKSEAKGRILYFITNVGCSDMNSTMNNLIKHQAELINSLYEAELMFKMLYLDESGPNNAPCQVKSYFNLIPPSDITITDHVEGEARFVYTCPIVKEGEGERTSNSKILQIVLYTVIPLLTVVLLVILCMYFRYKKFKMFVRLTGRLPTRQEQRSMCNLDDPISQLEAQHQTPSAPPMISQNPYVKMSNKKKNAQVADEWEINAKNLFVYIDQKLGSGAFATVVKGSLKGINQAHGKVSSVLSIEALENVDDEVGLCYCNLEVHQVAIKLLPPHSDDASRQDFFHEMAFMKRLGCQAHIVNLIGCVSDPIEPMIVVELCANGDLLQFLRRNRKTILKNEDGECDKEMWLQPRDLKSIAWQISDGMHYLASKHFIHRDLAARNVLLTKSLIAKVGDFGLCRYVDQALYTTKGGRLPIKWMSPESLRNYEYSIASDVWSYGVLLFELFSLGDGPYPAIQPLDMIKHLEEGNRLAKPDLCPPEVYDIMQNCWQFESINRPTFEAIRQSLSGMLQLQDEHYGYLAVSAQQNYLAVKRPSNS